MQLHVFDLAEERERIVRRELLTYTSHINSMNWNPCVSMIYLEYISVEVHGIKRNWSSLDELLLSHAASRGQSHVRSRSDETHRQHVRGWWL